MSADQSVHIFKHRTEIGASKTAQLHILHILFKFFICRNFHIPLNFFITLNDVDIYPFKITLTAFQDGISFPQKPLHCFSLTGSRCIDCNDKFPDTLVLPVFQRFHQRHIVIQLQTISIINVVKFIVIDMHFFPKYCKLPQKFSVIILIPQCRIQIQQQASCPKSLFM